MKSLKIFQAVFLVIFFLSCEEEPLHSVEENTPETLILQANSNGVVELITSDDLWNTSFNKSSHNDVSMKFYNSFEELKSECPDLRSVSDLSASGSITYDSFSATYFGAYIHVENGEELITVTIKNTSYEVIYRDQLLISHPIFFGIATEVPMDNISFSINDYNPETILNSTNAYMGYCEFATDNDTDGDGVTDDQDLVPNSNMEETVIIKDCDSSVENIALGDGYMLSDRIDDLEAGVFKNHGQYVKATAHYLASLVKEEILTDEEKDLIMECTGSSSIGK